MLPLRDLNPTRRPAIVTWALIAACVLVYLFVQERPGETDLVRTDVGVVEVDRSLAFTLEHAAVPCELTRARPLSVPEVVDTFVGGDTTACRPGDSRPALFPDKQVFLAAVTSIFLHGSVAHLAGNVLFLWVFGNNVEDRFGHGRYLLFYLAAGVVAVAGHVIAQPDSSIPVVGASGAIAGAMGAYLVLFPRAPVRTLVIWFIPFVTTVSARWLLWLWFISQFFTAPDAPVAWVAHAVGFAFGAIVTLTVRPRPPQPPRAVVVRPGPW